MRTQAENDQVVSRIAPGGSAVKAHLGFTDVAVEGSFAWTDGTAVSYTNWAAHEPNDGGEGEDCTALAAQHLLYSSWNDVRCDEALGYVCRGATPPQRFFAHIYRPKRSWSRQTLLYPTVQ